MVVCPINFQVVFLRRPCISVCLSAVCVCSFVSLLVCFVVVYFLQFLLILLIDARKEFVIATIVLKLNFSFDNIIFFSFFLSVCLSVLECYLV